MVVFNGITLQKYMFDINFCVGMFCFTLVCIWTDFVDDLRKGLPVKRVSRCAFDGPVVTLCTGWLDFTITVTM